MSFKVLEGRKSMPVPRIADMVYTNCHTRIVDLRPLHLPTDTDTSDSVFRQLYEDYISANKSSGSPNHNQSRHLASAITSLTTGIAPPIAFPTETVYGLGADATNPSAIAGIFAAKGRPSDNPLIIHVSSIEHLERCLGGSDSQSAIPTIYHDLIYQFWPGPLTILIPVPSDKKGVNFAPNVHPGQPTIGFRLPSSPYARFLIAVTDRPIAAPSANSSGKPSPTNAKHVLDDLDGKINFILDGGTCDVGVESTVVDGLGPIPLILRPGGLSKIELKRWGMAEGNAWANVENGWEVKQRQGTQKKKICKSPDHVEETDNHIDQHGRGGYVNGTGLLNSTDLTLVESEESLAAPRAPGMKYKHYAPNARMFLIEAPASLRGQNQITTSTAALCDLVTDILHQTHLQPILAAQHQYQNGDHAGTAPPPQHSTTIVLSVLTSTSWSAFANLESCFPGWDVTQIADEARAHLRLTGPSSPSMRSAAASRTIDLYSLDLGCDPATISNRLFAALRTCDDLHSDFILAEAPVKLRTVVEIQDGISKIAGEDSGAEEGEGDDEFETVLERMRKAASEIIQL